MARKAPRDRQGEARRRGLGGEDRRSRGLHGRKRPTTKSSVVCGGKRGQLTRVANQKKRVHHDTDWEQAVRTHLVRLVHDGEGPRAVEADGRPLGGGSNDDITVVEVGNGLSEYQALLGSEVGGRYVVTGVKPSDADGCHAGLLVGDKATDHVVGLVIGLYDYGHLCASSCTAADLADECRLAGAGRAVDQSRAGARHNRVPYLLPRGRSGFCCLHDDSPGSFSTICWCVQGMSSTVDRW